MTIFLSLNMSLRGVVENLEETPSSQERAFWRETSGAADTMSVPTDSDAYALDASAIRRVLTIDFIIVTFSMVDAMAIALPYCALGAHCRRNSQMYLWVIVFCVSGNGHALTVQVPLHQSDVFLVSN